MTTVRTTLIGRLRALLRPFRPLATVVHSTHRTVAAIPNLIDAILVLPALSQQLEVISFQTAALAEMHEELVNVRSNTAALPHLNTQLAQVHDVLCDVEVNTQAVQQLAEVIVPLHGAAARVGRFADRWPQRRAETRTNGNAQ
jgi:hypothetical protein